MAKRKKVVKKSVRRNVRRAKVSTPKYNPKNKISLVINNLLLFVALSLISLVLYRYVPTTTSDLLNPLFFVMAVAFGFVSVAFLIMLIILYVMKAVSKK
ncbi:Uncharacterised protein [uncultured archaeon]|nr:Uncharacterised protein [uncultured archaeon]